MQRAEADVKAGKGLWNVLFPALYEFIWSSLGFKLPCTCEISLIGRQKWLPRQIRKCCVDYKSKVFSANCRTAEENTLLPTIKCYGLTRRAATCRHTFRPDFTNRTTVLTMVKLNSISSIIDHVWVREFDCVPSPNQSNTIETPPDI